MQKKAPQFHWNEKSMKMADDAHAVGIDIVKTHLTPFLQNQGRKPEEGLCELAAGCARNEPHGYHRGSRLL